METVAPGRGGPRQPMDADRSRRRAATLFLAVVALALSPGAAAPRDGSGPIEALDGGITVINVPPQFSGFSIRTIDGLNYIDVVVSDYNSWSDVFRVRVVVEDELLKPVADIAFQQYPDNVTLVREPRFNEPLGAFLDYDRSSSTVNILPQTVEERTQIRVTFVLSPVKGTWLRVTASDLAGLEAFAQVEYQSGFFGGLPRIPSLLLVVLAIVGTVTVVSLRIRRDRRGE